MPSTPNAARPVVSFRVPSITHYEDVTRAAEQAGLSLSGWVRLAVAHQLDSINNAASRPRGSELRNGGLNSIIQGHHPGKGERHDPQHAPH